MKNSESFWIFSSLGLGDHLVCTGIYYHYAKLHSDKMVVVVCWEHNLASLQWLLSPLPNVFFYEIETEQQLLTCKASINKNDKLCLGFYYEPLNIHHEGFGVFTGIAAFNPVLWDSEFYRQAGLDPELKWSGFKLPEFNKFMPRRLIFHQDEKRGFKIDGSKGKIHETGISLSESPSLKDSCDYIYSAHTIHCIDSSMLNLADLMETPHCERFVFHRYARRGLPPSLKKPWEIID